MSTCRKSIAQTQPGSLGPLLDYGSRHATDMVGTLSAYLEHDEEYERTRDAWISITALCVTDSDLQYNC